ncbi:MAG: helix-turn-helix transcriptional regulator [Sphingomonas sp.]|nr:helix-turn-helix transcriptional regulator [Sphingomonas sp.]
MHSGILLATVSFVPPGEPLTAYCGAPREQRECGLDRDIASLSDRERQVLALLARSYDAKSIARTLRISVHTVNEQLRAARQKLGVTSSREAARLLLESEGDTPKILGDRQIGIGTRDGGGPKSALPGMRALLFIAGAYLMILLALLALTLSEEGRHTGPAAPTVIATSPGNGSVIAPGPYLLSVTFDQPMMEGDYSFVRISPETFPNCEHRAALSADRRTFSMRCTATAGRHYEVWFNRPPYMSFQGQSGLIAQPQQLLFSVRRY